MIDYSHLAFRVEGMQLRHLDLVMDIEQAAFSAPWSAHAYEYELNHNAMAHYYVALPQTEPSITARVPFLRSLFGNSNDNAPVIGYGGFWLMTDEAHISTIASHPEWRHRGVGELLLVAMIESAAEMAARTVTLEVRLSNRVAQTLYLKYGFDVVGERRRYYSDNGEDALIMTTSFIRSADYQTRFQKLKDELLVRLSQ